MKSKRDISFDEEILKLLRNDNLLSVRRTDQLKFLRKSFLKRESISNKLITLLNDYSREFPQEVIDFSKNIVAKEDRLITMATIARITKTESTTPVDKIEMISKIYEISSIFKQAAFFLSDKKVPLENLKDDNKLKILKYLSPLGLSKKDVENLRLIRNSSNHLLNINKNEILFPKKKKITIEELDELYKKTDEIFSYWSTFIFTSIWYNPLFGFLALFGLISYIIREQEKMDNLSAAFDVFFPNISKENKKKKEESEKKREQRRNSWNSKIRIAKIRVKSRINKLFGFNSVGISPLYKENFVEINLLLIKHSEKIADELKKIRIRLTDQYSIDKIQGFESWFRRGKPSFEVLLKMYELEGDELFDKKKNKKSL